MSNLTRSEQWNQSIKLFNFNEKVKNTFENTQESQGSNNLNVSLTEFNQFHMDTDKNRLDAKCKIYCSLTEVYKMLMKQNNGLNISEERSGLA